MEDDLFPFERMQRSVLVKREAKTSHSFGKDPNTRPVAELLQYSIINVDKPSGPTSHQVSAYVQHILNIKKSGHSGTLDPKVTGVLPVAIGRATRIVQALLSAGKEYIGVMHAHKPVSKEQLEGVIEKKFLGRIQQLPPIKSSVKRQLRYRKIYYFKILEVDGQDVLFRVGCQAGTYIRKLIHDLGEALGCGAHMAELRRTRAGPFDESTLCSLQDLTDAFWYYEHEQSEERLLKILQPIEHAVQHLPKVWILDSAVDALCHGADLAIPGVAKIESDTQVDEKIAIFTLKDELIALGISKMISKEIIDKETGIAVKTDKVFMQPGTYPKIRKA
ncbi:RNA-guided pseudouridylation complex pseudouridine synthase subunit Cbf5 [Candidatus Woesearchaeota archaeon]|nr:RNA-guided pseudouridylation complex pseudouridine synthase subunit Cbf5 [Candidatus Woesearchaeota archaeon]